MRMFCTLFLWLAVILNCIDSSQQSELSPERSHNSASHQQPAESTAPSTSSFPTLRQTFPRVLGFKFEDLPYIRLRPHNNPNRVFELQRYVFPPDKPIRLRKNNLGESAISTEEKIVLTTSEGEICAILDKKSIKNTILRAICTLAPGQQNRAKINMYTGKVELMTAGEIEGCPVSTHGSVTKSYEVFRLSSHSERTLNERHKSASSEQPAETTARPRSRSPTLRAFFPRVLGFRFEDLQFIRLRPHSNPYRVFELRRYVFPPDKPIRLRKNDLDRSAIPTVEQIVLSTSDGDVCAILDKKSSKNTILRAICTLSPGRKNRAKINMNNGQVEVMTESEKAECPVVTNEPITKSYSIFRV